MLQAKYDADLNARYHDLLCRKYQRWETTAKLTLAGAAVVSFAGIKLSGAEPWQTLSGVVAMIATTVMPLLKWNRLIPRIESERLQWIQLRQEYENAWSEAAASKDWTAAEKEFRRIRKRDNAAEKTGGIIPQDRDLIETARKEVIKSYGAAKES